MTCHFISGGKYVNFAGNSEHGWRSFVVAVVTAIWMVCMKRIAAAQVISKVCLISYK